MINFRDFQYKHKTELLQRGHNEGEESITVGQLLISKFPAITFEEVGCVDPIHDPTGYRGYDICRLYPAYSNGRKAWILEKSWIASHGHSAWGSIEQILSFEDGLKIFNEKTKEKEVAKKQTRKSRKGKRSQ